MAQGRTKGLWFLLECFDFSSFLPTKVDTDQPHEILILKS